MTQPTFGADVFPHVRLVLSMIVSLSMARLLSGATRFVQHSYVARKRSWIHLGWSAFMLLHLIHFWWWEYRLSSIQQWTFPIFSFVVFYAILFYVLCALLYPDTLADFSDYAEYFLSRRVWFFGVLGTTFLLDLIDTALKGETRFADLGPEYPIRIAIYCGLCLIAAQSSSRRFHGVFIVVTLVYQVSWILRQFNTIG